MESIKITGGRSIADMVCDKLRQAIIKGILKPGERLVEAKVAKEMQVSITPVRQAFAQLSKEGLIEVYPYRGTYVVQITKKFMDEVTIMRILLEVNAAKLALPHITEEDLQSMERLAAEMEKLAREAETPQGDILWKVVDLDIQFHETIYRLSNNNLFLEMFSLLQSRIKLIQSYGRIYRYTTPEGHVYRRHMSIIDAFRKGDVDELSEVLQEHIESGQRAIEQKLFPAQEQN